MKHNHGSRVQRVVQMPTNKSIKWVNQVGLHFGIKRLMSTKIVTNNYPWAQKLDVVDVMVVFLLGKSSTIIQTSV